jgi:hypothetical protein
VIEAKLKEATIFISAIPRLTAWVALALALLAGPGGRASGTWTPLANQAPDDINTMLLLPDGTVMAADADNWTNWYRLTPDIHGSYVSGAWTRAAAMHNSRLYYASDVLTNGRMFVAGGEYGSGASSGEIYDPLLNTWTMISPGAGQSFVDMISVVLPNSTILVAPVRPSKIGQTAVYDPETDSWPLFPQLFRGYSEEEASWVMLPDNSILTVDPFGVNTERYIPSLNQWVNDAPVPVPLYNNTIFEIGAFFLLANSNVFCIGDAGYTALYSPSGSTNAGSWLAGPLEPAGLGAPDAPAAMMNDGNVLCALGPATNYIAPTSFFEYDPVANELVAVGGPSSYTNDIPPYVVRMLDLPDGGVLLSLSDRRLYEYQPAGAPLPAGQPTITCITTNFYRSYHLSGTLLNGISQGAAYGDDAQMNSNYPLVRMTNTQGNVYYARTYNWSSTAVMTGSLPITTDFMVPQYLPAGVYSLVVVANGNSSTPVSFSFAPDNLQISTLTGFGAVGPYGGPVGAHSVKYALTNTGSPSINWSVGNIPAWLNVSPTNGKLTKGGGTASVTVGLNTAVAASLTKGNYAATLWFTNLATGAMQSASFSYLSAPLVLNGGFEYGSTAYWELSGNMGSSFVGNNSAISGQKAYIHSGFYAALLGYNAELGYLSQTIPAVAGQPYLLSFWLDNYSAAETNEFIATWNGTNLLDISNLADFAFTNFQFIVVGARVANVLQFGFLQGTNSLTPSEKMNFFGLDDISLTPVAAPSFLTFQPSAGAIVLEWSTMPGLGYQLQCTSNLQSNYWTDLGGALVASNTVATATDSLTNSQRFYRVLLLP